ncbi:hypothetical protein T05_4384 [Trichinella murrelli]|uniref:Uncharacterized protein n=1 Tax=Trichinella murrelli TaxID=144512 RepID=A0A0V0T091_9BILA|nr:hypothetical protein T05_4384 [Trichinella murrelli]
MYHSNVSGRSTDLRALLIASFIGRVSFGNYGWRELKETPSSNSKIPCQAIMFGTKCEATQYQASGSSECTVILSVMYHSNMSGRSTDLRALLIASFIGRVSFGNYGWRELKETPSSNWKIPCQAIMFGVSEKRPSSN